MLSSLICSADGEGVGDGEGGGGVGCWVFEAEQGSLFLENARMTYWPLTFCFVALLQCDRRLLLYCRDT